MVFSWVMGLKKNLGTEIFCTKNLEAQRAPSQTFQKIIYGTYCVAMNMKIP